MLAHGGKGREEEKISEEQMLKSPFTLAIFGHYYQ
jgi:hypothetical protein